MFSNASISKAIVNAFEGHLKLAFPEENLRAISAPIVFGAGDGTYNQSGAPFTIVVYKDNTLIYSGLLEASDITSIEACMLYQNEKDLDLIKAHIKLIKQNLAGYGKPDPYEGMFNNLI